jgi:hypothetical protein
MNNAEDCARYLCELASKPDTSDLRKQMEATIDEYLIKERSRVELAAAFANCDVPNRELRAFILKTITRHVGYALRLVRVNRYLMRENCRLMRAASPGFMRGSGGQPKMWWAGGRPYRSQAG